MSGLQQEPTLETVSQVCPGISIHEVSTDMDTFSVGKLMVSITYELKYIKVIMIKDRMKSDQKLIAIFRVK